MRDRAIITMTRWLALARARPRRVAAAALAGILFVAAVSNAAPGADARPADAAPSVSRSAVPTTPVRSTVVATASTPTPSPIATATPAPTIEPALGVWPMGPTEAATVVSVTDGDTIRVLLDDQNVPVRYIGIDTPETHAGYEWMGAEATAANESLVAGREVILEKDVSESDRFGRLLRYVWVEEDGGLLLVNLELVRRGFALVTTYPPDVKYVEALYLPAQAAAREAGLGLWAAATPAPAATPVTLVPPSCEASYPDVCVPLGSPDLDCGDVEARRFTVRWDVPRPDPHRFDGDHDGIGCEG